MERTPEVVVVGSACRDLVDDDERGWRLGGGASYSALALVRLGLDVGALIVADDLAAGSREVQMLRDEGVTVVVQPGAQGPIFVNVETPTGRIQRTPQVSDPVDPAALPPAWRSAGAWLFGPVAAECPDAWADVPAPDALVAVGWQGLLRVLRPHETVRHLPPGPSRLVARANLVGVGRDDFDTSITEHDLLGNLHPGATLLITDGIHGGVALQAAEGGGETGRRSWRSIAIERYVDPVGAGDTFLSGVFAAWVDPSMVVSWTAPDADLRLGAACGSLVLEGPGLFGVPHREDAIRRMFGHENLE